MTTPPPDTRPGLTQQQLEQLTRAITEAMANMRGGASVHVTDPRLSKAIVWLLIAIGGIAITVGTWLVTDAVARGQLDARVVAILELHDKRLTRLEDRKP